VLLRWASSFPPEPFCVRQGVLSAQAGIYVSVSGVELTTLGSIEQRITYQPLRPGRKNILSVCRMIVRS